MTVTSVRMMKEFRLLAWPWLGITSLAVIALYLQANKLDFGVINAESLTFLGFFAGMPLLAGLGLGSEFQYRTLGLTLAQPVDRSEIWRSKNLAAIAAILLPALLFCISGITEFKQDSWLPIFYVIIFTAAAFPMTLIARSTIGGTALNALVSCPVFWGAAWLTEFLRAREHLFAFAVVGIGAALLIYSAAMVRLGNEMFMNFQAAEGMQSVESILPGAGFVPAAVADWFRCRPSQLFLNLVRREFRLLRLIWPLTFLSVAGWTALIAFHVLPIDDAHIHRMPYVVLVGMISGLIALLCGCLSLGEERSWGTHDWQLTLPVSPTLQWAVKLAVGLFLSVVCAALLPISLINIGGRLTGNPALLLPRNLILLLISQAAAVTLVAFWCACLVKSTARASMLVVPLCAAIASGGALGTLIAETPSALRSRALDAAVYAVGVFKAGTIARTVMFLFFDEGPTFIIVAAVMLALVALQSRRLFRRQITDEKRTILRCAAPLFGTMFFGGLFFWLFFSFCMTAFQREDGMCRAINHSVQRLIPADASNGRPLQFDLAFPPDLPILRLTPEQLESDARFSAEARRWLSGAKVLIVPRSQEFSPVRVPHPLASGIGMWVSGYMVRFDSPQEPFSEGAVALGDRPYQGVLTLADGSTCAIEFRKISGAFGAFDTFCR